MDMKTENANSNPDQLPIDLNDLISAIQSLPEQHRNDLTQPLNRVVEYTKRRRRILNLIQEALSQLRMDMKYLMFDLEATRRERDDYKNALGGTGPRVGGSPCMNLDIWAPIVCNNNAIWPRLGCPNWWNLAHFSVV